MPAAERDSTLILIEQQVRACIRDACTRPTRLPFAWGGLRGYQQLEAIAAALRPIPAADPQTASLRRLAAQVERALTRGCAQATDLQAAHDWLRRIAACLRYPPDPAAATPRPTQVAQEMEGLLDQFHPDARSHPAQAALATALRHRWRAYGPDLLHCYQIPGLPPDNLALEARVGRLRGQQRRRSGRQSTRELRDFGAYQILMNAQSEAELLTQLRQVPPDLYRNHRSHLAQMEAPRRLRHRLHRDPATTLQQ